MGKSGEEFILHAADAFSLTARGALGGKKVFAVAGELQVLGDVGVGAEPELDISGIVVERLGTGEMPAKNAVVAAERESIFPAYAGGDGSFPLFDDAREFFGIMNGLPAPPFLLLGGGAGVFIPAVVIPGDRAIGARHPGELGNAVCQLAELGFIGFEFAMQAGVFHGNGALRGDGSDDFFSLLVEYTGRGMAEEQSAEDFSRACHDRDGEITVNGKMPFRHAVVWFIVAVTRVFGDVIAADDSRAVESNLEDGGVTRHGKFVKVFARDAGQGVKHVGFTLIGRCVVEEGAELGAGEFGGGVGNELDEGVRVGLGGHRFAEFI